MTPEKLFERYRDGYLASNWIGRLGKAIELIGFSFASVFFFGAYLVMHVHLNEAVAPWKNYAAFALVVLGAAITLVSYLIGTLISGMGQAVRAVVDTAVNTSPFLSTEQKGHVMTSSWWQEWKELKEEWKKMKGD